MALRNIMCHPTDDVLKKKSKKVDKINDRILILLEDMAKTMHAANGAGLAAVQVGILRRVIVYEGNFFLLIAKCTMIAARLSVNLNNYVFKYTRTELI